MTSTFATGVVDANVHLVASAEAGAPLSAWPSDWPPGQSLSAESYGRTMAAAGLARAVFVTTTRRDGYDNSYTFASAANDPSRFAAVGNLDILEPDALEKLEAFSDTGARGVRFHGGKATNADSWLNDPRAAAAWGAAAALGLVVSASRTRVTTIPSLRAKADRFPSVPIVVYSAGDPDYDESGTSVEVEELCTLAGRANVYLLFSVDNLEPTDGRAKGVDRYLERVAARFGAGRLMWGSFSKFAGARAPADAATLAGLAETVRSRFGFLSPSEQALVLGGTAESVYFE